MFLLKSPESYEKKENQFLYKTLQVKVCVMLTIDYTYQVYNQKSRQEE